MIDVEARAGCLGSSAPDTASENYDDDEAGAGGLSSSALDTTSDDEALGLVVMEAVLPMPPVVTGPVFLVAVLQIPPVIVGLSEIY